jgi:hypothetical protein
MFSPEAGFPRGGNVKGMAFLCEQTTGTDGEAFERSASGIRIRHA